MQTETTTITFQCKHQITFKEDILVERLKKPNLIHKLGITIEILITLVRVGPLKNFSLTNWTHCFEFRWVNVKRHTKWLMRCPGSNPDRHLDSAQEVTLSTPVLPD